MKSLKFFLSSLVILFTLAISNVVGQTASPVKWSYKIETNADKSRVLQVKATIDKGYHIFNNKPDTEGMLIPTSIMLVNVGKSKAKIEKEITDRYANVKAITSTLEGIGTVNYYENEVVFNFPYDAKEYIGKNKLQITYQCCNDKMCFPPVDLELLIK